MISDLQVRANSSKVKFNAEEYERSASHIKAYIKAEIARSIWDEAGFYTIYNAESNESFEQALTMFDDAQALVRSTHTQ
jgi:carboxyl-terminal processing protease